MPVAWHTCVFYFFKVLYVSNPTIIKEENDSFAKMKYFHIIIIVWDPSQIFLAVNDMLQLSSWNAFAETSFPGKKRMNL